MLEDRDEEWSELYLSISISLRIMFFLLPDALFTCTYYIHNAITSSPPPPLLSPLAEGRGSDPRIFLKTHALDSQNGSESAALLCEQLKSMARQRTLFVKVKRRYEFSEHLYIIMIVEPRLRRAGGERKWRVSWNCAWVLLESWKVMIELPISVVSYQKNCASRGSARLLYATITTHCTYNYSDHGTRVVTCTSEEPQARHREGSLDNMASGLQRRTHKQPIVALLWRYLIVALLWRRGVVAVPLHAKGSVMYWRCINAPCYSRCIIILVWSLDFSMYACIILQQRSKNGNNTGEL